MASVSERAAALGNCRGKKRSQLDDNSEDEGNRIGSTFLELTFGRHVVKAVHNGILRYPF